MLLDKSCAPYQQDEKILKKLNPQITMHSRKFTMKESIYCVQCSSTHVSPFTFLLNKDHDAVNIFHELFHIYLKT